MGTGSQKQSAIRGCYFTCRVRLLVACWTQALLQAPLREFPKLRAQRPSVKGGRSSAESEGVDLIMFAEKESAINMKTVGDHCDLAAVKNVPGSNDGLQRAESVQIQSHRRFRNAELHHRSFHSQRFVIGSVTLVTT